MCEYKDTTGGRKAPCYQCQDRHIGCHDNCDRYRAFLDIRKANKTSKDVPMMMYLFDQKIKSHGGLYK